MPVQLRWLPRFIASEHRVYRSTSPIDIASPGSALATLAGDANSYFDTDASDGQTYYYVIGAVNSASPESIAFSRQIVVETGTGPDAPPVEPPTVTFYTMAQAFRYTNLVSGSLPIFIPWQAAKYDTSGIWSAANPTRLTVPSGASQVRLHGRVRRPNVATVTGNLIQFYKNGSVIQGTGSSSLRPDSSPASSRRMWGIRTAILAVTPGDYFELQLNSTVALADNVNAVACNGTFMEMEIIA